MNQMIGKRIQWRLTPKAFAEHQAIQATRNLQMVPLYRKVDWGRDDQGRPQFLWARLDPTNGDLIWFDTSDLVEILDQPIFRKEALLLL